MNTHIEEGILRFPLDDAFAGISQLNLQNAIVLDVGANTGAYALGMAALGARRVYAIEPGPPFFSQLRASVVAHKAESVVSCHQVGLGKAPGILLWYRDLDNPCGNAHVLPARDALNTDKIRRTDLSPLSVPVRIKTLDAFVTEHQIAGVDLIKIDVEGMEWDVLSHGRETIRRHKPVVVAETLRVLPDCLGVDYLTPMFQWFYDLGYESFTHQNNTYNDAHDYKLARFLYPNFTSDTFFIHPHRNLIR